MKYYPIIFATLATLLLIVSLSNVYAEDYNFYSFGFTHNDKAFGEINARDKNNPIEFITKSSDHGNGIITIYTIISKDTFFSLFKFCALSGMFSTTSISNCAFNEYTDHFEFSKWVGSQCNFICLPADPPSQNNKVKIKAKNNK